jgi:hypothetical protein
MGSTRPSAMMVSSAMTVGIISGVAVDALADVEQAVTNRLKAASMMNIVFFMVSISVIVLIFMTVFSGKSFPVCGKVFTRSY